MALSPGAISTAQPVAVTEPRPEVYDRYGIATAAKLI